MKISDSTDDGYKKVMFELIKRSSKMMLYAKEIYGNRNVEELKQIFENMMKHFEENIETLEKGIEKMSEYVLEDCEYREFYEKSSRLGEMLGKMENSIKDMAVMTLDVLRLIKEKEKVK